MKNFQNFLFDYPQNKPGWPHFVRHGRDRVFLKFAGMNQFATEEIKAFTHPTKIENIPNTLDPDAKLGMALGKISYT